MGTISLERKFISAAKLGDKLVAKVKFQKKTKTLVFLTCEIINAEGIVAVTSGVWKILKINK
jgi:Thioesterase superfamily.